MPTPAAPLPNQVIRGFDGPRRWLPPTTPTTLPQALARPAASTPVPVQPQAQLSQPPQPPAPPAPRPAAATPPPTITPATFDPATGATRRLESPARAVFLMSSCTPGRPPSTRIAAHRTIAGKPLALERKIFLHLGSVILRSCFWDFVLQESSHKAVTKLLASFNTAVILRSRCLFMT